MVIARFAGSVTRRKIALSAVLVLAVALAWVGFANRTPLTVTVEADGPKAILTIGGQQFDVPWDSQPTRVRFIITHPLLMEYQIDGSDTTSNGTTDIHYFERFSKSPYYRFVSWLRDDASYDRWSNIRLKDKTTGTLIRTDSITEAQQLFFPSSYIFSVDIYHPEKMPTVLFINENSNGYLIGIYRDAHGIEMIRWEGMGTREIMFHWFYPFDARPHAAILMDTLAHLVLWAAVLVILVVLADLALVPLLRRPAHVLRPLVRRLSRVLFPWVLLAVSFGLVSYISLVKYNAMPHIFDSVSIYFQAKIFASGRIYVTPPPSGSLFDFPFMAVRFGRYHSQYPPGSSASIALFMALCQSLAWLSGPFLSLLTVAGIFAIARRMYNRTVAVLAVFLTVLSPFYSFMAGSFMSHPYSLFYLTFFLLFLLRYYQDGHVHDIAIAGALLGMSILTRESATAFFAGPWLVMLLGASLWKRRRKALLHILVFAVATALVASLYLWYNWQLTGKPFVTPRQAFDPNDRYGFGTHIGWHGRHNLAAGLINADEQITLLLIHLFGWPYYLTLAPAFVPFITGRFTRWDWANAIGALAFIGGYVGYFYHGIVYGPRYYYEALPFFVILTARGFQVLADVSGAVWLRLWAWRQRWLPTFVVTSQGPSFAASVLLVALVCCNLFYYLPRQMVLYEGFAGGGKKPDVKTMYTTKFSNAVIITRDSGVYRDVLCALNCPDVLECDVVYVVVRSKEDMDLLRQLYPNKQFYEVKHPHREPATFTPLE